MKKTLLEIKKEVQKNKKGKQEVDRGILDLVVGLQAFNIPTQFSCEGHITKKWTYPYVDIYADDSKISFDDYSEMMIKRKKEWIQKNISIQNRLINLLEEFYKTRTAKYKYQIVPHSQLDLAMVKLKCIGSDLLQSLTSDYFKQELAHFQKEMQLFGSFLIKKYNK